MRSKMGELCILTQSFLVGRPEAIDACKLTTDDIERYGLSGCARHEVMDDD